MHCDIEKGGRQSIQNNPNKTKKNNSRETNQESTNHPVVNKKTPKNNVKSRKKRRARKRVKKNWASISYMRGDCKVDCCKDVSPSCISRIIKRRRWLPAQVIKALAQKVMTAFV